MTYENFLKVILGLQRQDRILDDLYSKRIDLNEFVDPYHEIVGILFNEIYTEEGADWIHWFCYENDFGTKGLEAFDENRKPICYSHQSLWEYLEANYQ